MLLQRLESLLDLTSMDQGRQAEHPNAVRDYLTVWRILTVAVPSCHGHEASDVRFPHSADHGLHRFFV